MEIRPDGRREAAKPARDSSAASRRPGALLGPLRRWAGALALACVGTLLTPGDAHARPATRPTAQHPATNRSAKSHAHANEAVATRSRTVSRTSAQTRAGGRLARPTGRAAASASLRGGTRRAAQGLSNAYQAPARDGTYRNGGVVLSPAPSRPAAPGDSASEETVVEPDTTASTLPPVQQILARGSSALQYPAALRGFFQQLRSREDEPGNGTVRVMQWGDSHTAADMFTGELRARMQARFGDGGVGFTYAGHPFAGYRILGSGRNQSGGWRTLGTHFTDLGDRLLGLGGVAIEGYRAGETATLDAPCLTFTLQYLRQPGGGGLQVSDNGQTVANLSTADANAAPVQSGNGNALPPDASTPDADAAIDNPSAVPDDAAQDTAAPTGTGNATAGSGGIFHYNCQAGSHHFTFTTGGGGPVRLLGSVALQPGITWEAMGINGAEAPLILRWNQPLFQGYLAGANPALIVLAYGTNEAAARWTGEDYRQTFTRLIQMLHTTSPSSSILVLGPGDRSIGSTYYTTTYSKVGRGRRARRVAHRVAHRVYTPYRGTDRILNAQRSVCSTTGLCAFWDWRARQGGFGSMNRWVGAGYAQPDHTHLTGTGYRALADALTADLLSAYSAFGADRNGSPTLP